MSERGVGKHGFVAEHGLLTDEQRDAAARSKALIDEHNLRTVRLIWVDQHGAPRCKFMSTADYVASLDSGIDFSAALFSMDSANNVFTPLFVEGGGLDIPELTGFPDMVLVPDPTTFRVLPWADRTGWVLTDAYFSTGRPVPIDGRLLLRRQVEAAAELGYDYVAGLEVEFYVVRRDSQRIELSEAGWPPPPPKVSVLEHGYQYLSEVRLAGINDVVERLRDAYLDLGLPLRSIEDEWGPGQIEITFDPMVGLEPADAMILFRTAAKQVTQQMGLLASFMARPALPHFFSSGWHLHESLRSRETGENAFMSDSPAQPLSDVGRQFTAGLIEHANEMMVFSTPTITGYKRYKPYSFAPNRANWAIENRGAFIRVQGGPMEKGAHIENRVGEPSANPYFYLAANIAAGLDGIRRNLTPPPLVESDPYATEAPALPGSLWEAVAVLEQSQFFKDAFGPGFVNFITAMKRNECNRFLEEVTDWEMREYFEFF
ncbi:MAG TPA: glutamine synthetase family protein [Mycobacteriales bacterium]|nr:glutamine synthetase family protein [Mycobacteriales bacterium]